MFKRHEYSSDMEIILEQYYDVKTRYIKKKKKKKDKRKNPVLIICKLMQADP
jgi:hypothetical protein